MSSSIAFDDDTPHGQLVASLFGSDQPRPPASFDRLGVAVVDEFSAMGASGLPVEVRPVRNSPTFGVHLNRAIAAGASRFVDELASELRRRLSKQRMP